MGVLQFEVVQFRIEHEYNVKVRFTRLPYGAARWIFSDDAKAMEEFVRAQAQVFVTISRGKRLFCSEIYGAQVPQGEISPRSHIRPPLKKCELHGHSERSGYHSRAHTPSGSLNNRNDNQAEELTRWCSGL